MERKIAPNIGTNKSIKSPFARPPITVYIASIINPVQSSATNNGGNKLVRSFRPGVLPPSVVRASFDIGDLRL